MARATQVTVVLDNKVGALSKLCSALKRAKVNVQAISVVDTADTCAVRLLAQPSPRAVKALRKSGASVSTQPVVTAKLVNKPGALAAAAGKLAKAKVNIHYCYGSAQAAGKPALVVFAVDKPAKAARVLG